ncbi:hypothetical protein BDW60DRAFT_220759 [Aspergillus nidulans var. acristatus]
MGSVSKANVPRIDVSPLFRDDQAAKMKVAQQINAASCGTGFFYAVNHGINVQRFSYKTKELHMSITPEEKWDLAIRAKTPTYEVNVWPDETKHSGFQDFAEQYCWEVFGLFSALLKGYALLEDTLASVVLLRYPHLDPYPDAAIKTAADGTKLNFEWQEDVSIITVLYQSKVQNLQVETAAWYQDIEADDTGYLIHCGSYMEHLTNNYYKAPIHRAKWVNAERQSPPFLFNLGYDSVTDPFDPRGPNGESAREPLSYGDYLRNGLMSLLNKNGQT